MLPADEKNDNDNNNEEEKWGTVFTGQVLRATSPSQFSLDHL